MTVLIVALVLLPLALAYAGGIVGLRHFARWAEGQELSRSAAAKFDRDFIPEASDVVATEHAILVAETESLLDEALQTVKGWNHV